MLKEQRVEEFAIDLVETPDPSNPAILVTVSAKGFDLGEIPKCGREDVLDRDLRSVCVCQGDEWSAWMVQVFV